MCPLLAHPGHTSFITCPVPGGYRARSTRTDHCGSGKEEAVADPGCEPGRGRVSPPLRLRPAYPDVLLETRAAMAAQDTSEHGPPGPTSSPYRTSVAGIRLRTDVLETTSPSHDQTASHGPSVCLSISREKPLESVRNYVKVEVRADDILEPQTGAQNGKANPGIFGNNTEQRRK